jgi:hypothetical protein
MTHVVAAAAATTSYGSVMVWPSLGRGDPAAY